nr:DUF1990 domain-containing protein [Lapillicoccus sp.]
MRRLSLTSGRLDGSDRVRGRLQDREVVASRVEQVREPHSDRVEVRPPLDAPTGFHDPQAGRLHVLDEDGEDGIARHRARGVEEGAGAQPLVRPGGEDPLRHPLSVCRDPRRPKEHDHGVPDHLRPSRAAHLRAAELTYPEVGITRPTSGFGLEGYRAFRRSRVLPASLDLDTAADAVLGWRMHRGAGIRVRPSDEQACEGTVLDLLLGVGRLAITAPCRVVYVVDEPHRSGFAYGTLPGHPESGEESFVVERSPDGTLTLTITAVSRPATRAARLAGPLGAGIQDLVTQRYLRALT